MTTTTTPTSGMAIQRYKIGYHADEWGQRSSTPSGIPDASGSWVRYADHVTALAAGQAPAAQTDSVQEDAARYRLVRRGQHWSVVDGIGNDLRAEALDAAVDAARKQGTTP